MSEKFEDRYGDVLQNIEFAIVSVYREHPDLADFNVDRVLEGLIRVYMAEERQRLAPTLRLNELDQPVFERVREMCEWRLGRSDNIPTKEGTGKMGTKKLEEDISRPKRGPGVFKGRDGGGGGPG